MTNHAIQTTSSVAAILLDRVDNKDLKSQVQLFLDWLTLTGDDWRKPAPPLTGIGS